MPEIKRTLIKRGMVEKYPNGQRIQSIYNNAQGNIERECTCTTENLHYEVVWDHDKQISIWHHAELIPVLDMEVKVRMNVDEVAGICITLETVYADNRYVWPITEVFSSLAAWEVIAATRIAEFKGDVVMEYNTFVKGSK